MEAKLPYRVIISGGGTGGHIYPAIAIANALREIHDDIQILFVGAKGRMEMQKVPEAGYEIIGLPISGIQRKISLKNLAFPLRLISSLIRSVSILNKFKPQVVVGVGGYASGPILYTAARKKIPTVIQEQNSYAGLTNKLLAKKVNLVCVAHEGLEKYFPKDKIVITGNPVRKDIGSSVMKSKEAADFFNFSNQMKTILVMGGSLGARTINDSIFEHIQKIIEANVQLIWQTGAIYFEEFERKIQAFSMDRIRLFKFLKEMDLAYAISDVVVSRAGALSISELSLVNKPVIFVPSPNVAEDHQTKNARALVEKEAALMIPDDQAKEHLVHEALKLLAQSDKQAQLSKNIAKLARPDAARDIALQILDQIS